MENFDSDKSLERIFNPNIPASISDYKEIGEMTERVVDQVSGVINNITSSITRIQEISAQVNLELGRMNAAIDALMVKAQMNIKIYETSLPTLDKQFERCQDRMDKLIDKCMDLITSDLSIDNLNRQEAMMSLIEMTNNSMNSLISKLIPKY